MNVIVLDKGILHVAFYNNARPGGVVRILSSVVDFTSPDGDVLDPAIRVLVARIEADPVARYVMHDAIDNFNVFGVSAVPPWLLTMMP